MEWLAVASAVVPGTSATTRALATSQTLTTARSAGSWCSWSRVVARPAVVFSAMSPSLGRPTDNRTPASLPAEVASLAPRCGRNCPSAPEDPVDDRPRPPRRTQVVVDHVVGLPRLVAQHRRDRRPFARVARQLVGGLAADQRDRVADPAHQPPRLGELGRVVLGQQARLAGGGERLDGAWRPQPGYGVCVPHLE